MLHQMHDHLWQGNLRDALAAPADVVISCTVLSDVSILRDRKLHAFWPIADVAQMPDMVIGNALAKLAARLVALNYDVLWNCDIGHNRSGLGTALTLIELGVARGQAVVDYVKARNPDAFTTPGDGGPFFAQYLAEST